MTPDNSFAENSPEATPHARNGHRPPKGKPYADDSRAADGNAEAPTNEFTFGWNDLEISDLGPNEAGDSDLPAIDELPVVPPAEQRKPRKRVPQRQQVKVPARTLKPTQEQSRPLPAEGAQNPRVLRLARQAAQSVDPVVAVGLIAASAPLVLQEDELLPSLLGATTWVAWRLHRHPARRRELTLLPMALQCVATKVRASVEQGRALPTRLVIRLLLKQIEEQKQRSSSLPKLADDPATSCRESVIQPRRDALARLNQILEEWGQDEPRVR